MAQELYDVGTKIGAAAHDGDFALWGVSTTLLGGVVNGKITVVTPV